MDNFYGVNNVDTNGIADFFFFFNFMNNNDKKKSGVTWNLPEASKATFQVPTPTVDSGFTGGSRFRCSGPHKYPWDTDITVLLFAREGGSYVFGLASRSRANIRGKVENGAWSGAEDCGGGIRNIGCSSGVQIGQSWIPASEDTRGNWQERRQDINK